MKNFLREFIKYAVLPLVLILAMGVLAAVFSFFDLPDMDQLVEQAEALFGQYGYRIIFIGAVAEGLLLANWYLPGSVVVVMGVVFAAENGYSPVLAVVAIIAGFLLTALVNYALGRYGWYRLLLKFGLGNGVERARVRLKKHGPKAILMTYFHPNVGAFTATGAGVLRMGFRSFLVYSVIGLVVWNTLWGLVVYNWGPGVLDLLTYRNILLVLIVWVLGLLLFFLRDRRTLKYNQC